MKISSPFFVFNVDFFSSFFLHSKNTIIAIMVRKFTSWIRTGLKQSNEEGKKIKTEKSKNFQIHILTLSDWCCLLKIGSTKVFYNLCVFVFNGFLC